jgi:uncharacterized membrane protein YhaH (DUF805 family)
MTGEASMNFGEAITSGFSNYVNFSGRAIRSEYWYWVIGYQVTTTLFGLAVLLPGLAVTIRRLHDLDRTGWWFLLSFVPIVGWIILIVWYCTEGTRGTNRFGPDRLAGVGA